MKKFINVLLIGAILCLSMSFFGCGKQITIKLDANGGSVEVSQVEYKKGDNLVLPTPKKPGYDFVEWLKDGERFIYDTIDFKSDIEIVAKYKPKQLNVTFDLDGGFWEKEGDVEIKPESKVVYNTQYSLVNPKKNGFEFIGWKLKSSQENDYLDSTFVWVYPEDTTFIAVWNSLKNFQVTLEVDSRLGILSGGTQFAVNYGEEYDLSKFSVVAKGTNYFKGWYFKNDPNKTVIETKGVWNYNSNSNFILVARFENQHSDEDNWYPGVD